MTFREFIDTQTWIYAKSYADKAPHEYCLKEKTDFKKDFVDAVKCIQQNGFTAFFWKKPNTYLYLDGYFYWVMHPIAEEVILINRCKAEDYKLIFIANKKGEDNVLPGE